MEANELADSDSQLSRWFAYGSTIGQLIAWFCFLYGLYYFVPGYKQAFSDFEMSLSDDFQTLQGMSDFVVIYTDLWDGRLFWDESFFVCLLVALTCVFAVNVCVQNSLKTGKLLLVWSTGMFMLPVGLLAFEVIAIQRMTWLLISQHPEVLEYGIRWISL